jgi:hypothetical protein
MKRSLNSDWQQFQHYQQQSPSPKIIQHKKEKDNEIKK